MQESVLVLIGTLGGTLIGALAGFCGAWIKEKYDTKRHLRSLIVETAIKDWSRCFDFVERSGEKKELSSLSNYIAHYAILFGESLEGEFDVGKFNKAVEKSHKVTEKLFEYDTQMKAKLKKE